MTTTRRTVEENNPELPFQRHSETSREAAEQAVPSAGTQRRADERTQPIRDIPIVTESANDPEKAAAALRWLIEQARLHAERKRQKDAA